MLSFRYKLPWFSEYIGRIKYDPQLWKKMMIPKTVTLFWNDDGQILQKFPLKIFQIFVAEFFQRLLWGILPTILLVILLSVVPGILTEVSREYLSEAALRTLPVALFENSSRNFSNNYSRCCSGNPCRNFSSRFSRTSLFLRAIPRNFLSSSPEFF